MRKGNEWTRRKPCFTVSRHLLQLMQDKHVMHLRQIQAAVPAAPQANPRFQGMGQYGGSKQLMSHRRLLLYPNGGIEKHQKELPNQNKNITYSPIFPDAQIASYARNTKPGEIVADPKTPNG